MLLATNRRRHRHGRARPFSDINSQFDSSQRSCELQATAAIIITSNTKYFLDRCGIVIEVAALSGIPSEFERALTAFARAARRANRNGYINRNDWLAPTIAVLLVGFSVVLGLGYWLLWIIPIKNRLSRLRRRLDKASDRNALTGEFPKIDAVFSLTSSCITFIWLSKIVSCPNPRAKA